LAQGQIDLLFAFQNEKKIFAAADHRCKQVVIFAGKGGKTGFFRSRFRLGVGDSPDAHELPNDLIRNDSAAMVFTPEDVRKNSPKSLSLVELRTQRDLDIFRKIYDLSIRVGDNAPGWQITYVREFDMTNDSKLFPPLKQWEVKGYKPDVFGRWIGPQGESALPLLEGRMIGLYDFSQKGWVEGKGRTAVWREIEFDYKCHEPQFLMAQAAYENGVEHSRRPKLAFMDVTSSTNTRTFVGAFVPPFPGNHKVPMLSLPSEQLDKTLGLLTVCNSLCFDFMLRNRFASTSLGWFILEELPIPVTPWDQNKKITDALTIAAARLSLLHRRFAPQWLKLKQLYPELASKQWKHWWAVTEADRLRLRVEIDAFCSDLYGLDPDDFDWIVRDDPTDPKGFYRVDRKLPFRERLTGLAASAFRALKEAKWSAESAALLSNDEFFEIVGIPELTNAQAAHAKGLPGPLIAKRDGCHVWKPENFSEDDPRHGWTWDDCWNDAVALLGSEAGVVEYLKPLADSRATLSAEQSESFKLVFPQQGPVQRELF